MLPSLPNNRTQVESPPRKTAVRVLFLEFDGVLHPASAIYRFTPRSPLRRDVLALWLFRWSWILDELLSQHPDVAIVAHSNWRHFVDDGELKDVLGPLARRFIGTTPRTGKWDSIHAVVRANALRDYRILDAWPDPFPSSTDELILCDSEAGLKDFRVQNRIASWLTTATQAPSCR